MSFSARNFPAFGISKSVGRNNNTTDERPIHNMVDSTMRIPIVDLNQRAKNYNNEIGEIVLNTSDSLLYYSTGSRWIPLAITDMINMEIRQATEVLCQLVNLEHHRNVIIEAPDSGNVHLIAGNNVSGAGGHVHLSAGHGGFADGEIYLDVGGERALTIKKTLDVIVNNGNFHVNSGDLVVKSGNLELENPVACINCNIARAEVTMVEPLTSLDDEDITTSTGTLTIPDVNLNSMSSILTVNLELTAGNNISGVVNNSLLKEDSWISITAVNNGSGTPYVWLDAPRDGLVHYHIRCIDGELSRVQLHFDVRNSL